MSCISTTYFLEEINFLTWCSSLGAVENRGDILWTRWFPCRIRLRYFFLHCSLSKMSFFLQCCWGCSFPFLIFFFEEGGGGWLGLGWCVGTKKFMGKTEKPKLKDENIPASQLGKLKRKWPGWTDEQGCMIFAFAKDMWLSRKNHGWLFYSTKGRI